VIITWVIFMHDGLCSEYTMLGVYIKTLVHGEGIVVVLAAGPKYQVGSRSMAMGLTTRKTRTIGKRPVLVPKTRHLKLTILAPNK